MIGLVLGAFAFLSIAGCFCLTALSCALHRLHKKESKKEFKGIASLFVYRKLHRFFFPFQEYEGILFATSTAQALWRVLFIGFSMILLSQIVSFSWLSVCLLLLSLTIVEFIVGEWFPRVIGNYYPNRSVRIFALLSNPFLIIAFPLTYIALKISHAFWPKTAYNLINEHGLHPELIEIFHEADLTKDLNPHEKKMIESLLSFRERIAREVMVPRVDLFSLKADTTIKEAANLLQSEGYSRTPVYRQNIDDIVGVLMYKDIMAKYMEYEQKGDPKLLDVSIETIVKPPLYAPETKKISSLLQDFRKKQVHLAIIVDEYGGTEGIVTIEDILEEIVGEIEDEYDEEENLFIQQPDGSWVIDARTSILDVEEQLGISIPQEGDYDTVGGYIFHQAGAIPSKGFVVHHDDFTLEILRSNDRFVEKVKIKPRSLPEDKK